MCFSHSTYGFTSCVSEIQNYCAVQDTSTAPYLNLSCSKFPHILLVKRNDVHFNECDETKNYLLRIQSLGQDSSGRQHASVAKVLRRKSTEFILQLVIKVLLIQQDQTLIFSGDNNLLVLQHCKWVQQVEYNTFMPILDQLIWRLYYEQGKVL